MGIDGAAENTFDFALDQRARTARSSTRPRALLGPIVVNLCLCVDFTQFLECGLRRRVSSWRVSRWSRLPRPMSDVVTCVCGPAAALDARIGVEVGRRRARGNLIALLASLPTTCEFDAFCAISSRLGE